MFKIVIFLIFAKIFITSCVNFCEIENKFCGVEKHVACDINTHPQNLTNFELRKVLKVHRKIILNEVNNLRNNIANGIFRDFPGSSNMKKMEWDDELAYIAGKAALKFAVGNYGCVATEKFQNPGRLYAMLLGDFNSENDLLHRFFDDAKHSLISRDPNYTLLYVANNSKIGCGYATYQKNLRTINVIKCLTNSNNQKDITKAYGWGEACSECHLWGQGCDDVYKGLCQSSTATKSMMSAGFIVFIGFLLSFY